MDWIDIAGIVFVCVTMNHLGLISDVEGIVGFRIHILNCPKCASFWFTIVYAVGQMGFSIIPQIPIVLAVSFLASYSAIWLELFEGYIDTLYLKLYGKITSTDNDNEAATSPDDGNSASTLPKL